VFTPRSDHAAQLASSLGASVFLEPRNEAGDGESLGHSARAGTGASLIASTIASCGRGSRDLSDLGRSGSGGGFRGGGCSRRSRRRRSGRRSRRGRSRSWGSTRATTHLEVNARLIGLVDGRGVPEPLNHAVTSVGALGADIGHGDFEVGPVWVLRHGAGGEGVLVPADEGLANDLVGLDADDGHVGGTVMGSADLNLDRNLLARSVAEDLAGVRKGNTLALPDAAVGVRALEVLNGTLDVTVLVGVLGVEDLITTSSLQAGTWLTRNGALDEAVGGDGGDEASKGDGSSVGLHCAWFESVSERKRC
jgi:hypothetical protein